MKAAILLMVAPMCVWGCAKPQLPDRAVAIRFVKIAVSDENGLKPLAAIKQLRQMSAGSPLDCDIIMTLLGPDCRSNTFCGVADADIARIAAGCGPKADQLLFRRFESGDDSGAALALVALPTPEITRMLVKMADSEEEPAVGRRLCRLILAARGDKSRDWMALVVEDVRAAPKDYGDEYHAYEEFLSDLGCVACKLPRSSALPMALLERTRQYNTKPTEGAALDALVSLAICAADVRPVTDSPQFKEWLAEQPGDGEPGGFMAHLVRACLGVETNTEMHKALLQLGTYGVDSDKVPYCFAFLSPWLEGADVREAIHRGLLSSDDGVRRGALLLLVALGPDARDMLPAIRKSFSDEDDEFREFAAEMFEYVAGLDDRGRWNAEADPEYRKIRKTIEASEEER